jgi:hypothetical protein
MTVLVCVAGGALHGADGPPPVRLVGIPVAQESIIDQRLYAQSGVACTPASMLTALRVGPPTWHPLYESLSGTTPADKLAYFIKCYGSSPSTVEPKRAIFTKDSGVVADDFPAFFNPLLEHAGIHPLTGRYFDRAADETQDDQLRRIHDLLVVSLRAGVPVVTSIRVFGARLRGTDWVWEGLTAHCILITAVPEQLENGQEGFLFRFVEPSRAAQREGYIYREMARGFQAPKGGSGPWLVRSFLLIQAPGLFLETERENWYARTFMTLNFGLGHFSE